MADSGLVLGLYILAFCISCVLGGIESSSVPVRQGHPITIQCSVADKPSLPKLQWVFVDINNISKVIGEQGNPHVRRKSDTLLELKLVNASMQHTGFYACRDQKDGHKSHTEMSLHIVVTDSAPVPVTCSPSMLQCGDRCIASRFQCDRVVDCVDELDELNCPTECEVDTEFRCENGQCIKAHYVCDNFHALNCRDGSDESHCPDRHYVYTGQIQPVGTGDPPHVLAYESRNWQVHGIYSVVAGVIGLVCVVTIIVITICRIHMRRDAQLAMIAAPCTRTRTVSARSDDMRITPRPAVAVYVQSLPLPAPHSTELTGLVVSPPPYSELKPHTDTPPPPYEAVATSSPSTSPAVSCSLFPAEQLHLQRISLLPTYSDVPS